MSMSLDMEVTCDVAHQGIRTVGWVEDQLRDGHLMT